MYATKRGSRKSIRDEMRTENFVKNLRVLSGQEDLNSVAHDDTIAYLFVRQDVSYYEQLQVKMIRRMIRKKVFDRYRLPGGYFTVAIDGVPEHTFDYEHCEECLVREDANGNKQWYHKKVQGALVFPNKMCIPIATEYIRNEDGKKKQDCEIKAAYRLIKRLRQYYPRMKMCVVLDALYCGEPIFQSLEKARMAWIVVFKKGSMSEVWEYTHTWMERRGGAHEHEVREEKKVPVREKRSHEERKKRKKIKNQERKRITERVYRWMHKVPHWNNKRKYNYVAAQETVDGKVKCDYEWLVSGSIAEHINRNTIEEFCNHGGRVRWKIENEGIHMPKNGGCNLEHCYSKDPVAMKIFHVLLDISHIIMQLIEKGSLIGLKAFGSMRNIGTRLLEALRMTVFTKPLEKRRIQIRLVWDTS